MSPRVLMILMLSLFITKSTLSHSTNPPVLDKSNKPLERGRKYYIKPAITDNRGEFTIVNKNGTCPFFIGQENTDLEKGLPVFFTPFAKEDKVIKENRDFKVAFLADTICAQITEWKLGETDSKTGRRLIASVSDGSYFRIEKGNFGGVYSIRWCPRDVCPSCKFNCSSVGNLQESWLGEKKILLALDGNVLPVVFERAYIE